jgi:hypothetical protein
MKMADYIADRLAAQRVPLFRFNRCHFHHWTGKPQQAKAASPQPTTWFPGDRHRLYGFAHCKAGVAVEHELGISSVLRDASQIAVNSRPGPVTSPEKLAFGHRLESMEPFAKPLDMEGI